MRRGFYQLKNTTMFSDNNQTDEFQNEDINKVETGANDESSKNADEADESRSQQSEEDKLKAERREKAHNDAVKSFVGKVASGELTLEDAPYEKLKADAEAKLKAIASGMSSGEKSNEDKIVEKVRIENKKDSDKELLSEEEKQEYDTTYADLEKVYGPAKALQMTRKIVGILSPEERERRETFEGSRAIPAGSISQQSQKTAFKRKEDSYMESLPPFVRKLQKVAGN